MAKETKYIIELSPEDKIFVSFTQDKGKITKFVLQYHTRIDGKWHTVVRYDTCHGKAHEHRLHFRKKRLNYRIVLGKATDYNQIYTLCYDNLRRRHRQIKENYLLS